MNPVNKVSLDHMAGLITAYDQALAEVDKWQQAADILKGRIQHEMGEADEATVGGADAFSWKHTGKFNAKRFTTEQPDLVIKYTHQVTRDELDMDALKKEQPDLFTAYRSRTFLRKH